MDKKLDDFPAIFETEILKNITNHGNTVTQEILTASNNGVVAINQAVELALTRLTTRWKQYINDVELLNQLDRRVTALEASSRSYLKNIEDTVPKETKGE